MRQPFPDKLLVGLVLGFLVFVLCGFLLLYILPVAQEAPGRPLRARDARCGTCYPLRVTLSEQIGTPCSEKCASYSVMIFPAPCSER